MKSLVDPGKCCENLDFLHIRAIMVCYIHYSYHSQLGFQPTFRLMSSPRMGLCGTSRTEVGGPRRDR